MTEAYIIDAVRTPVGRRNGALAGIHPVELSSLVLRALVERTAIDPVEIDDVVWGCVTQTGDQSSNVARFAVLGAGWPETVPGTTLTRACGSSQQALDFAAASVRAGHYDLAIAGGVESMSRVPMGETRKTGLPYGAAARRRYPDFSFEQGDSAELIAQRRGLSRTELDEYAAQSHARAVRAIDAGKFVGQIIPVITDSGEVTTDEGVRPGTTVQTLSKLKPAFREDGVIHAGNASQISDGAAALLVASPAAVERLGLTPMARYVAGAVVGSDPIEMLTGPIPATQKVLTRAGLSIDDLDAYEVNEAFAPVPLAWLTALGASPEKMNPLGGAIALGHPLGGSGAILMTKLIHHLRDTGGTLGLQTMCEGGGMANATIVERVG
jgi:acetyl-CoA acyltransferase